MTIQSEQDSSKTNLDLSIEEQKQLQYRANQVFTYIESNNHTDLIKYLQSEEGQSLDLNSKYTKSNLYSNSGKYEESVRDISFLDFALERVAEKLPKFKAINVEKDRTMESITQELQVAAALINEGAKPSSETLYHVLKEGYIAPNHSELFKIDKVFQNYPPRLFGLMMNMFAASGVDWNTPLSLNDTNSDDKKTKGEYLMLLADDVYTNFAKIQNPYIQNQSSSTALKERVKEQVIQFLNNFGLPELKENYQNYVKQQALMAEKEAQQKEEEKLKFSDPLELLLKRRRAQIKEKQQELKASNGSSL